MNMTLWREWVPEDDVMWRCEGDEKKHTHVKPLSRCWRCEGSAAAAEQGGWVRKGSDCTPAAMLRFFILSLRAIPSEI